MSRLSRWTMPSNTIDSLSPWTLNLRGQRVERVEHLGVGAVLAAALAQHLGGQLGQPLLARRIVDGADLEEEADGDQRARRRLQEHGADAVDLAGAAGLARRGGRGDRGAPRRASSATSSTSVCAVILMACPPSSSRRVRFVGVKIRGGDAFDVGARHLVEQREVRVDRAEARRSAPGTTTAVFAVLSAVDSCAAKAYFTCDSTSASVLSSTPSRAMRAISSWIAFST